MRHAVRRIAEATGLLDRLRAWRHIPDRTLHPARRRALESSLREGAPPRSALFVCHGNIYRSPYAAAVFQERLTAGPRAAIRVESAGFVGPGRPSPDAAIELAAREGLDLVPHRSALLTPQRVAESDWVVVMDRAQQREIASRFGRWKGVIVLGDLDPTPIPTRTIVDPWNQGPEVLAASYARIRRCVEVLAGSLAGR